MKRLYKTSFDTTMKLAKAMEMNPNSIIVETYQSQLRHILLEFIKVCHENNVRIPYEEWVKTNLPLLLYMNVGTHTQYHSWF